MLHSAICKLSICFFADFDRDQAVILTPGGESGF